MAVIVKEATPSKIERPSNQKIARVVAAALKKAKKNKSLVEVTFICNARMRALNKKYRGKDKTTDVLSFAMGEDGILGDVFISKTEAAKNAYHYGVSPQEEILRLLAHGVLHLLGYEHGPKMFRIQEEVLCRANS